MHKQLILLFLTLIWLVNGRDRERYDDDQDRSNRGRSRYSNDPDRSNRGRHRYNSNHDQFYNCQRYENKIYQLKITLPGKEPFYAGLRLQSYGTFDELFSIAGGNNTDELGISFALSNRVGYYKCLADDRSKQLDMVIFIKQTMFNF
ncbi:hypothetical protein I4U23_011782 [Adineta vaga]|nr:hypothetical protein I4U23_011782 [Adineta vaga]